MKYSNYAVALLKGKLYDSGIPYHPPLFAWVLAGIYKITGIPTGSGYPYKVVYSVINSIVCVLLYFLAKEFLIKEYAIIICILFALSFGMLIISATPCNESIYLLIVVLTLWLLIRYRHECSYKLSAIIGVLCGLGALTKAEHLAILPFIILYLIVNSKTPVWQNLKHYAILVIVMFIVILPWSLRNYLVLSDFNNIHSGSDKEPLSPFVLVTNYGAINFAIANNQNAHGDFRREILNTQTGSGGLDLDNPQHRHYFLHGYSEGFKWIKNNPSNYAILCYKKFNISLDALALGFTSWNFPSGLTGVRRPVDVFAPSKKWLDYQNTWKDLRKTPDSLLAGDLSAPEMNWFKYLFMLLVASGLGVMLWKNAKAYLIFHFFCIHKIIVTLLFFGYVRQILSIYPVIVILACYPLVLLKDKAIKIVLWLFIVAASVSFVYEGVTMKNPKNYIVFGSSDPRTGYLLQDDNIYMKLKER